MWISFGKAYKLRAALGSFHKNKDQMPVQNSLWQQCLRQLERELTPQQYNTWIRPLQAVEADKPTSYVLVDAQASELLIYPITCKALEASGNFSKFVKFAGSDCCFKFGADYKALFTALSEAPGETTTKLVSEP